MNKMDKQNRLYINNEIIKARDLKYDTVRDLELIPSVLLPSRPSPKIITVNRLMFSTEEKLSDKLVNCHVDYVAFVDGREYIGQGLLRYECTELEVEGGRVKNIRTYAFKTASNTPAP